MTKRLQKTLAAAFLGVAAAMFCISGEAATAGIWPERPITMVVPFPPGGPTDMVARLLSKQLGVQLGQPVIVQNMPGANGIVAMRHVAKARGDGYTVMYNTSSLVLSPSLYPDAGFDPLRDFTAVSSTAVVPLVLVTHPSVPVDDFRSFVALAKENEGELSYASAGVGNVTHLTALLLLRSLDIRATHVAYGGSKPALVGVMGGQTHFMMNTVNDSLAAIRDGKLRALAVSTRERVKALPEVPTVDELGVSGFEAGAWQGVVAPAGTPPHIVQRWSIEIRKALASQEVRRRLTDWGAQVLGSLPREYALYIREEYERWNTMIRTADVRWD